MKHSTKATGSTALRRPLAVLVVAAGLTIAGCANNAPGVPSEGPSLPVVTSTLPAEPQAAPLIWAASMCQALGPAFDLGPAPRPDLGNLAATRQSYIDYLGKARNAAQQAIDQVSSVGAPPVNNGQQILDNVRTQLTQLRKDLDDGLAQLNRADPNDAGAIGLALAAAAGNVLAALGNRLQVFGTLARDPQLRTALEQTPECQNLLIGTNATTGGS